MLADVWSTSKLKLNLWFEGNALQLFLGRGTNTRCNDSVFTGLIGHFPYLELVPLTLESTVPNLVLLLNELSGRFNCNLKK